MNQDSINLPQPDKEGTMSVEEAIAQRRSRRDFKNQPVSLKQISQILWAAQGITDKNKGYRSAPSAGALYPLEIYLVVGENGVENLNSAVYHYQPNSHTLQKITSKNLKSQLTQACLGQDAINQAPVSLVITAVYQRTTQKYGQRGKRYVHLETGHAAENVYLQVEALKLGTVVIGAFNDKDVQKVLSLPNKHQPLYVMPIGYPQ